MPRHPVKVVFFDAAGTLFHVKGSVAEVYLHYAKKYGVKPSKEKERAIARAFKKSFSDAPPPVFMVSQPEKLKQCERLWWFDLVHAVFYQVGMFEGFDEFFDEVFEAFGSEEHWELYPESLAVLADLKGKGYELGVLSNFDTRLYGILRKLGLIDCFDSVTISSLAYAVKPAQKIFQYALDQHAVDPEEAVHVGDSVRDDFEGAREANLKGLLLARDPMIPLGKHTIRNLADLDTVLGDL